ncbi:hypothetical protein M9Y10_038880 [Tritrichomonas musculus]|uniref:Uncharacterized protein n=1 Tax=Tritrichomonas musculus TaxID=1915356 RepID=A0ABR2KAE7_9EUKA
MSTLFDDADGGPASLFAPVKPKSESKENSSSKKEDELPSLFSLTSKKTSKKTSSAKDKKESKNNSKEPSNETEKEGKKSSKKKKESKKSKKNKEKDNDQNEKEDNSSIEQPENETAEITQNQPQKQKPKPKAKKVVKKVVVRRKNTQDIAKRTLNHIQNEITEQFAEIFTTVEGLINSQKQPTSPQQLTPTASSNILPSYKSKFDVNKQRPLSNDEILIKLQEAISDSLDKDRVLQVKQVSIKKMESTLTLTEEEEKSQLRKKVADLMETIAAESANTADSQSEHEFRASEISRLRIELENVPKHYASIEGKLRTERDEEVKVARDEYEKVRYSCENRIRQAKDKVRFFNEQIILEGSKMANMATEKDLRRAVQDSKNQLKDVVKNVALTVKDFVDNKVSKDKKYSGTVVRKVAMIALKKAMNRILNPDAEEENEEVPEETNENENGGEEEEEEAENPEEENVNENEEDNNENDAAHNEEEEVEGEVANEEEGEGEVANEEEGEGEVANEEEGEGEAVNDEEEGEADENGEDEGEETNEDPGNDEDE